MGVADEKVPPVPQLIAPIKDVLNRNPDVDLSGFRFENSWMQWFQQLKVKVDVINSNVSSISEIVGTGVVARDSSGTLVPRDVAGDGTSITVTNGSGALGNPTIKINPSWIGQIAITTVGTITTGTWQGTTIGNTYLDAAPKMVNTSSSATGGAASTLPALPSGYVEVTIGGVTKKMAYYD